MSEKNKHQDYKDSIEDFAKMWEKAQAEGIFKEERPPARPAGSSFFGVLDQEASEEPDATDAQYWSNVAKTAAGEKIITEVGSKEDITGVAKSILQSPNPIRQATNGMDQDVERGVDPTFEPEDIDELAELKVKLHALEDKLNTAEGKGQTAKGMEKQIAELKEKIDAFSDSLGQSDTEISQQGD